MTWNTAPKYLRAHLITQCRTAAVATQAGIPALTWASSTSPRVFNESDRGWLAACRLPCVTVMIGDMPFAPESRDGGTLTLEATISVHCGSASSTHRDEQCEAVMMACLASIRNEANGYDILGSSDVELAGVNPMWSTLSVTCEFELSYDRTNFSLEDI